MTLDDQFAADFRGLTAAGATDGYSPLRWQIRLFKEFCQNRIPKTCGLPTGMGKTSVIHLWLLARRHQEAEQKPKLPTRLVYVVDRRTVVDQATEIAERIKSNLPKLGLQEGYLSVSTLRGQFADNLDWTRDPSRLAIIIGTVDMIGSRLLFSGYRSSYKRRPLDAGFLGQDSFLVLDEAHLSQPFEKLIWSLSDRGEVQRNQGAPMRVMCMSATSNATDEESFSLVPSDLEGEPKINPIVQRYEAKKRLDIKQSTEKVTDEISKACFKLAGNNSRVVAFVRRPEDARKIADAIKKKLNAEAVEVLTGTMRGYERDGLLTRPVLKRFLDGNETPDDAAGKGPAVLVSTSAGEVGFDLNADHMVCDVAPLDSMIQRLGRVNRRGYGDAAVLVFVSMSNEKEGKKKGAWGGAAMAAIEYLKGLAPNDDGTLNASPKSIDALRATLTEKQLEEASSPKPKMAELTDILLDAWSMTSVTERMPGRPPVGPWLRGVVDEEPETTIAWRAELDIAGFDQLESEDLEDWFDAHRVLPHETLTVPTDFAGEWLAARWKMLRNEAGTEDAERSCMVEREALEMLSLKTLVEELDRKRIDRLVGASIILPATFGGIADGMLHKSAMQWGDVADARPELGRRRLLRTSLEGRVNDEPLMDVQHSHAKCTQFSLDLAADDSDLRRQLVSLVPKRERPEFGTQAQALRHHVQLVQKYAEDIAERLALPYDIFEGVRLAAQWHDRGKDRPIWQRAADRKPDEEPLGKSGGRMGRIANGYRHEFGSLCEFTRKGQEECPGDVFDLAMHLIATHHGRGRPHFPKGGFDPQDQARSQAVGLEVVRRFARLQRRYGYWQLAWLENLLRCADAMASADSAVER